MSGRESVRLFLALIRMKDENLGGGGGRGINLKEKKITKIGPGFLEIFVPDF